VVTFAVVAAVAYLVDVATKVLAVDRLSDGDVALLGDWFSLTLVRNPGAAFGMGTGFTFFLSLLATAAVVTILWFSRRLGSRLWAVALGLLLAGIAGNLTDRLLREPGLMHGHVIDFFRLPSWPVFNVADICINVGGGLLLLAVLRGIEIDGRRAGRDEAPDRGSVTP
jgi:signal peptidase II